MDLPSTVTLDTKSCYLHNLSEAEQIPKEDTGLFWKLQKLQFSFQFFYPQICTTSQLKSQACPLVLFNSSCQEPSEEGIPSLQHTSWCVL